MTYRHLLYAVLYTPLGRAPLYPINVRITIIKDSRSLNLRMKSSCSDFARCSFSSCLQVRICQSGLSCSGYRSSNVFILLLIFMFTYIIVDHSYSVCKRYDTSYVCMLYTLTRALHPDPSPDIALRFSSISQRLRPKP